MKINLCNFLRYVSIIIALVMFMELCFGYNLEMLHSKKRKSSYQRSHLYDKSFRTCLSAANGGIEKVNYPIAMIDLRSDTVTKPSDAMRQRMFGALVGDDVFHEDPTVQILEDKIAEICDKDAALFFPSGTMANLAATSSWCSSRGAEMILGDKSHIFLYEQGGTSQIAGIHPRSLPNLKDGTMDLKLMEDSIRTFNVHFPTTELICLENTHNACGGRVLNPSYMKSVRTIADRHQVPVHLDGARLWNAANSLNIPMNELCKHVDSVSVCLSKGLGAPAGSLLVGSNELILRARRVRKVLGGGMRQVGILAAAGIQAIEDFESGILIQDHIKAKKLATAINELPLFDVEVSNVETNIIMVHIPVDMQADATLGSTKSSIICSMLKSRGILALPFTSNTVRLVIHRDIMDENIQKTILAFYDVSDAVLSKSGRKQISLGSSPLDIVDIESGVTEASALPSPVSIPSIAESNRSFYEEVVVEGMSVSDNGFTVILKGLVSDRFLAVPITPSDPMADGLDRDIAETAEAVTLLQLFQGIDVESHLPRDLLSNRFNIEENEKQEIFLHKVVINQIAKGKIFSGKLFGFSHNLSTSVEDSLGVKNSIALLSTTGSEVAADSISSESMEATDTTSSTLNESEVPVVSNSSSNNEMTTSQVESITSKSIFSIPPNIQADKEVEIKSSFETIALALRHRSILEVEASLLQNEHYSYNDDELKKFFPKLLYAPDSAPRYQWDLNDLPDDKLPDKLWKLSYAVEIDRLYHQLNEAKRQGRDDKVNEINGKIDELRIFGSNSNTSSTTTPPMNAKSGQLAVAELMDAIPVLHKEEDLDMDFTMDGYDFVR